jgi:hypothetical protein
MRYLSTADIIDIRRALGGRHLAPAQEDIMIKHLIIAALFAVGGAGVVLVGYLASEPLAFTHPVEKLLVFGNHSPATIAALTTLAASEPETLLEPERFVLAEVHITPRARSTPKAALVPVRFDPCSAWRDMGPALVDPDGTGAVRTVRALCAQSDDDR